MLFYDPEAFTCTAIELHLNELITDSRLNHGVLLFTLSVSVYTDLVSLNKTEMHIELYISFRADICLTVECGESGGTDIPLELEK